MPQDVTADSGAATNGRSHERGRLLDALRRRGPHRRPDRPARTPARSPAPARRPERARHRRAGRAPRLATPGAGPGRPGRTERRAGRGGPGPQRRRAVLAHGSPARRKPAWPQACTTSTSATSCRSSAPSTTCTSAPGKPASTIIPGAGFGVVATNCLARYVSDAVGGAQHLEVAARAATARQGPGIAASVRENLPYGGWTRRAGHLQPQALGSGTITITLPGGPCRVMPFPTGDLEAAFQATGAPDITAYCPVPDDPAVDPRASDTGAAEHPAYRSFGWARAAGPDGATAEAWLQTGESYAFTAAASIRAVEETLARSVPGAFSPAAAFGADFALTIPDTTRIDTIPAEAPTRGPLERSHLDQMPPKAMNE